MNEAPTRELDLERVIDRATAALLTCQHDDGHWLFELEADATIPAEYVLLRHYLAEPGRCRPGSQDRRLSSPMFRARHGGWPLFAEGDLDVSATVKAYFALKMIGNSVDADHMRRAREAVRTRGGAANANVFTRIMLALFGFIPWHAVPVMPVEIMLLPSGFPSTWIKSPIGAATYRAASGADGEEAGGEEPQGRTHRRTFARSAANASRPAPKAPQQKASWFWFFRGVDNVLRANGALFPSVYSATRHRSGRRLGH